jgi:hypothetical protein
VDDVRVRINGEDGLERLEMSGSFEDESALRCSRA